MRKKKWTVSETETHRVVTLRGRSMQAYCGGCGRQVEMFMVERAAEALAISVPSLLQRISDGGGHFAKTGGILWVCGEWLSQPP